MQRGTIRKRGNRYQVDTYVSGDRVRRMANTAMEARELLRQLNELDVTRTPYYSLNDLLQDYTGRMRARQRKTAALELYEIEARHFCKYFGPEFPASEINDEALDGFIRARLEEGMNKPTVNNSLSLLPRVPSLCLQA